MVQQFYTTLISVDPAQYECFVLNFANSGKGGFIITIPHYRCMVNFLNSLVMSQYQEILRYCK